VWDAFVVPRTGYGAGSEPRLDRMACFWSLPEAVLRAGFEELVTTARSAKIFLPVRTVTWPSSGP
jgi:hypothetical protein